MKALILSALLASVAMPAFAADAVYETYTTPAAAPYDWSGAYVGGFLGGGSATVDVYDLDGYNLTGFSHSYKPSGFYGGLLAGYNFQQGSFVGGIEGELSYLGLKGSAQFPAYVGVRLPSDSVASIDSNLYASLTARLGFAFNNMLIYGKGGIAGLNTKVSYIDNDPTGITLTSGTSATKFLTGYTVGGGAEVALNSSWTLRGEYMFTNVGSVTNNAASGATPYSFRHDLKNIHTGKVVLSYKW